MIGLLDPALFLPRNAPEGEAELRAELDQIIQACRKDGVRLLPIPSYWPSIWSNFGKPLELQLSSAGRRTLQELRKLGEQQHCPYINQIEVKVWRRGFQQLFNKDVFQNDYEHTMALAVAYAAAMNEPVVLFVRRMISRNLSRHQVGASVLDENTRWVLYVQLPEIGAKQILCVYNRRNLQVRWTSRYDWRLPAADAGVRYPFCPPEEWWKGKTVANGTIASKHVWIDKHGNGWARPNIANGAGYHWDVYLRCQSHRESVGVDQINVVQYGAKPEEGLCGSLHHVPSGKAGKVSDPGWTC